MKMIKIIPLMLLLLLPVASAQTGLFSSGGSTAFLTFGIIAVVAMFVIKALIDSFRKKK